ncbi:MAG TPA: FG-GAP-like repeat-containing protein [Gemmataceae bacterium]
MDFDGDGIDDLISGSYDPGALYLFRGQGGGEFKARETITDKSGKPVLLYPDQEVPYESFGSWVAMVDWDADGDLDLVLGGYRGEVMVRFNEGTRKEPSFATKNVPVQLNGKDLTVPGHHATPVIADWDGDGTWDLLSGSDNGAVYWYRNVGKKGAPEFAEPVTLVPEHKGIGYEEFLDIGEEPKPGIRSQIAVADYDGDGKLDLLLGDFCTNVSPKRDLTEEQRKEMFALLKKSEDATAEARALMEKYRSEALEYQKTFPEEKRRSKEVQDKVNEKFQQLYKSKEMQEKQQACEKLGKELKQYLAGPEKPSPISPGATPHGYVWLFLRK